MIIQRLTVQVRRSKLDRLIQLHHSAPQLNGVPLDSRIMTCKFGQRGAAVLEFTFEDLAASEAYWTAWHALPETETWLTEFEACHKGYISNEIWDLR